MDSESVAQNKDLEAQVSNDNSEVKKKEKKNLFGKTIGEKKEPTPTVPIFQLWRFASTADRLMLIVSVILSIGMGAMMPSAILILGQFLDISSSSFGGLSNLPDLSNATVVASLSPVEKANLSKLIGICPDGHTLKINMDLESFYPTILSFVYFGCGMFVAGYFSQMLWVLTGENQTKTIRQSYVHAILRQDLEWFDKSEEGSLATRLAQDTQLIQDGISEKAGLTIQSFAGFTTGLIVAFTKGWKLALVLLAALPILGVVGSVMIFVVTKYVGKGQDAYADAGAIAEQVISGIRTVYAFSLQARFKTRYVECLDKAHKSDLRKGQAIGTGFGMFMLTLFCTYGLAFWYGSRLVLSGDMTPGTVIVVFMSILIGAFSLINIPPNLSAISSARGAAYKIFKTIDRKPEIDSDNATGVGSGELFGDISFKNVRFHYPSRPDIPILKNLTLDVKPGMTVAFVGPSGSGKSTSVALVQRFYDAVEGTITIDGVDIKKYNLKFLRDNIGVVAQEPVLFNTTIKQNILMGTVNPVTEENLIEACKLANCHDFIINLPQGYNTTTGESGSQLSGGQKQRIAIARALIRNPKILLLDEATSALDSQSERIVQRALDTASKNRTTIVIAHRLSTIRNADLIVVMAKGDIIEKGSHDELLALNGTYTQLVEKQKIKMEVEKTINSGRNSQIDDKPAIDDDIDEYGKIGDDELKKALEEEAAATKKISNEKLDKIEPTNVVEKKNSGEYLKLDDKERFKELEKLKKQRDVDNLKEQNKEKAPVLRVLKLMKPEWPLITLGLFGASIAGVVFPVFSLIFTQILTILNQPKNIDPGPFQGANIYSFGFVLIGIAAGFAFTTQVYSFEAAGAGMTRRLRTIAFDALMRQEIGFFDLPENSLGALTSQLATDASKVGDLVTKVWGDLAQMIVTGICGAAIAFYYGWQLTLIILCMVPILAAGPYFESRIQKGHEDATKRAYEDAGEIASEAIKQMRTVAGLNRQEYFEERFAASVSGPHKLAIRKAVLASLGNGSSQAAQQLANAVGFYAGIRLADNCIGDLSGTFTVIMAVMITAQGLGRSSSFSSTYNKAKIAALKVFNIIDRETKIDPDADGYIPDSMDGDFEFKNISFTYPARPTQPIFTGAFNISGKKNTTVALVGPSGCGKSTTIGMLQRWYDCTDGEVLVDGKNVKDYQLKNGLRSNLSLVGQEPVLFDLSISDNISYGSDQPVTEDQIIEAAQNANIYEFVKSLPDGFSKFTMLLKYKNFLILLTDTRVGNAGSQLSGGQKQRVAIARALIRNPRILLLDEATSALDSESEKLVQEAIDKAVGQGGRTTITIAHRLSTIQDSDVILVIKDGHVVEQGTHFELLRLDGVYAALVKDQNLNALQ
ncbi:Multidrug resistance protein 1 [Nowakowskiella sp. JEL0078]|nr:Multidrug resistance protein 1 [Nowakowskiella sp. JEL0078]